MHFCSGKPMHFCSGVDTFTAPFGVTMPRIVTIPPSYTTTPEDIRTP